MPKQKNKLDSYKVIHCPINSVTSEKYMIKLSLHAYPDDDSVNCTETIDEHQ